MNIIPKPNNPPVLKTGFFTLPSQVCADTDPFKPWCVNAFVERCSLTLETTKTKSNNWLRFLRDEKLPEEGYLLTVNEDGVTAQASCEKGIIWALTALAELADNAPSIPFLKMEDSPRYSHRGLNLDCSRHFFSADEVKKIIDQISRVKMNVLHWHLSDDQGWRIESKKFPLLHEKCGVYYTQDEIRSVVEYAQIRGVQIIPEIDMPGHTLGLLTAYPQYSCGGASVEYAVSGGIYNTILCPGKEETFNFLEELFEEICSLFPSDKFHLGGDEAPKDEWQSCPACRSRMEKENIKNHEDLQGYFSMRAAEILQKFGKRPIFWNDVLLASNTPKDMIVQYWNPLFSKQIKNYIDEGKQFIYSDMFSLYLDYPHAMSPLKNVYNTQPVTGKINREDTPGLLGFEACLWTEHIKENKALERLLFPRIFAAAEISWTREKDYGGFLSRLEAKLESIKKAGVSFTQLENCNPKGKARRREAVGFLVNTASAMPADVRSKSIKNTGMSKSIILKFFTEFLKPTDIPFLLFELKKNLKR